MAIGASIAALAGWVFVKEKGKLNDLASGD